MKQGLFLLVSLLYYCNCQAQTFEWAKKLGSNNSVSEGRGIACHGSNVYVCGRFDDTIDFDPGPAVYNLIGESGPTIFISKYDTSGNFIWAKKISSSTSCFVHSITIDPTGNILTTGQFFDTVDFDPGPLVYNLFTPNSDVFILKLNSLGNFIWAKQLSSTINFDSGYCIVTDSMSNIYCTGTFQGVCDFNPGAGTNNLTSAGMFDIFILKLDSAGNYGWAWRFGSSGIDEGLSISIDNNANLYATGVFRNTVDFNPGVGTFNLAAPGGNSSAYILKLDALGNFIWAKQPQGSGGSGGSSITVDNYRDEILLTGGFSNSTDFDPGAGIKVLNAVGLSDIFILKLTLAGDYIWAGQLGGNAMEISEYIKSDSAGNFYVGGLYESTLDIDPGVTTYFLQAQSSDMFLAKFDSLGNFKWVYNTGGINYDVCYYLDIDNTGNIYYTGFFMQTVDFDNGPLSYILQGASSFFHCCFFGKIKECSPIIINESIISCESYLYPDQDSIWTVSGMYTIVKPSSSGCDSLIMVDVIIGTPPDLTVNLSGDSLTAVQTNAIYQWIDCNNNGASIPGENNQVFYPSVNGNYAVTLNQDACIDTSGCVTITNVGLEQIEANKKIIVYPTLVNEAIYIEQTGSVIHGFNIYDITGQMVAQNSMVSSLTKVEVSHLNTGTYFMRINDQVFRFVIVR